MLSGAADGYADNIVTRRRYAVITPILICQSGCLMRVICVDYASSCHAAITPPLIIFAALRCCLFAALLILHALFFMLRRHAIHMPPALAMLFDDASACHTLFARRFDTLLMPVDAAIRQPMPDAPLRFRFAAIAALFSLMITPLIAPCRRFALLIRRRYARCHYAMLFYYARYYRCQHAVCFAALRADAAFMRQRCR